MSRNAHRQIDGKWFWLAFAASLNLVLPLPAADTNIIYSASNPSHVCEVEDPGAIVSFQPDDGIVQQMVDRGVARFTNKASPAEAWRSLVSHSNTKKARQAHNSASTQ